MGCAVIANHLLFRHLVLLSKHLLSCCWCCRHWRSWQAQIDPHCAAQGMHCNAHSLGQSAYAAAVKACGRRSLHVQCCSNKLVCRGGGIQDQELLV
ncbi:hypothetical protein COO60DRAFT_1015781 [Scenedesmus sp. NREL 46B-D3]|nr:hypothetical protein COO60DRAFT_1015781 [Scenedesmus sp. NREL 46B-D3]